MKALDKHKILEFKTALSASHKIMLVPHTSPDGDAIGSLLGLTQILKNMGKETYPIVPNAFPEFLNWIKGSDSVIIYDKEPSKVAQLISEVDMLICLDFNQTSRVDDMAPLLESFQKTSVLIDHHPYPQNFTSIQFSQPDYSSTCELVLHIIEELKLEKYIDINAANALYCGMLTDTGSFNHGISDPQTFNSASKLITLGINPEEIRRKVFNNYSESRMKLMGHCLSQCMTILPQHHAAIIWLSLETQKQFSYQKGDSEGFVNMPLSIKGIHASVLLTENEHQIKASLRSQGEFSVNEIATKYFGGGGHKNAAGCEIKNLSLQESVLKFKEILAEYAEELKATKLD